MVQKVRLWLLLAALALPAPGQAQPAELAVRARLEAAGGIHAIGAHAAVPSATIASLHVAEGDRVAAGQALATLSHATLLDRQVAAAAAAVATAERRLAFIRRPWKEPAAEAARAVVAQRRADLALAERQLVRISDLFRTGVRGDMELDQRRADAEKARAQLAEAEANLAALTMPSETEVALAEAELAEARAKLAQMEAERALATLRAPAAGTVLKLFVRAGDLASSRVLMEIADLERLRVIAEVQERLVPQITPGRAATVELPGSDRRWPATVRLQGFRVSAQERPAPDQLTARGGRMVEVELALQDSTGLPAVHGLELLARLR